jgi:hypothetical protein
MQAFLLPFLRWSDVTCPSIALGLNAWMRTLLPHDDGHVNRTTSAEPVRDAHRRRGVGRDGAVACGTQAGLPDTCQRRRPVTIDGSKSPACAATMSKAVQRLPFGCVILLRVLDLQVG